MSTLSDSSIHEDEQDIVADNENQDSRDDLDSLHPVESAGSENEDNDGKGTGRRIDPGTSTRHVRNPIPQLNSERLKGPKGIHTIEKYFEDFKFHGRGHEKSDLDRVMKRMEHWAHRLFPKLHIDDLFAKVEQLGTKKDVKVYIKRYRQDMITSIDDSVVQDNAEAEKEKEESEPTDEFDLLIAEQIEKQKQVVTQQKPSTSNIVTSDAFDQLLSASVSKNSQPNQENTTSSVLSDEVKERIERNRQQAIKRRLERLAALQEAKKKKLEDSNIVQNIDDNVSDAIEDRQVNETQDSEDKTSDNGLQKPDEFDDP